MKGCPNSGRGLALVLITAVSLGAQSKEDTKSHMTNPGYKAVVQTMPAGALLAAAGAVGSPAAHRHLVNPGGSTTFMIRLLNSETLPISLGLSLTDPPPGFRAELAEKDVKLDPGQAKFVQLKLSATPEAPPGTRAAVKVQGQASSGKSGEIVVEAETTSKRKIYYISIDSFGPAYLELNARGNRKGKDGDWLMPNLRALLAEGSFFPNHKSHLIAATDMNHASYLSGAYPGRLGLYCVDVYLFGFNRKGVPIFRTTPLDLMYYGPEGKPVTTIFNVVKDPAAGGNPNAFTAYVSGKPWVPEHYRNPVFGLDRIATVNDRPDYVSVTSHPAASSAAKDTIQTLLGKTKNPDHYLWMDTYTVQEAMEVVQHEDPDVLYLLLGGVDEAGHLYGSGKDLDEWDERGTPDNLADDVSRVNDHANRLGIIKTVKNADAQLGRFLDFLKERGDYDNALIVVESDHNMETVVFSGPPIHKIMKTTGYSAKKDFYAFTASQMGVVFLRRDDPKILPALEQALEGYRMKNPITGKMECPMVVISREEMKTGIDRATGEQVTPPMELYSEFYLEHPKAGGLKYPDMFLLAKQYYQFPVVGVGLANVGFPIFNVPIPHIYVQIGSHSGRSTQPALLSVRGPGIPRGVTFPDQTYPSDVAPFLYRTEGYTIPESVQGKGLPIGR